MQFLHQLDRCLNCGLGGPRNPCRLLISDLTAKYQNILSQWTGHDLFDGDKICLECISKIQKCETEENPQRQFGHPLTCVGCGKSTLRTGRRIEVSDTFKELYPWYEQCRKVETTEPADYYKLCGACYSRTKRILKDLQKKKESASVENVATKQLIEKDEFSAAMSDDELASSKDKNFTKTNEAIFQEYYLILSTHSRAPVSRARCMVPNCTNKGQPIPRPTRKLILIQSNFYLHRRASLCKDHIHHDFHKQMGYNYFRINYIEDMLFLMEKEVSILNFDCVNDMPEHICKYWTGLTVEEFKDLYEKLNVDTGSSQTLKNALAAHLLRERTGDSIVKLANLFLMSTPKLSKQLQIIEKSFETYNLLNNGILNNSDGNA